MVCPLTLSLESADDSIVSFKAKLESVDKFDETLAALDKKLEDIAKELKL